MMWIRLRPLSTAPAVESHSSSAVRRPSQCSLYWRKYCAPRRLKAEVDVTVPPRLVRREVEDVLDAPLHAITPFVSPPGGPARAPASPGPPGWPTCLPAAFPIRRQTHRRVPRSRSARSLRRAAARPSAGRSAGGGTGRGAARPGRHRRCRDRGQDLDAVVHRDHRPLSHRILDALALLVQIIGAERRDGRSASIAPQTMRLWRSRKQPDELAGVVGHQLGFEVADLVQSLQAVAPHVLVGVVQVGGQLADACRSPVRPARAPAPGWAPRRGGPARRQCGSVLTWLPLSLRVRRNTAGAVLNENISLSCAAWA